MIKYEAENPSFEEVKNKRYELIMNCPDPTKCCHKMFSVPDCLKHKYQVGTDGNDQLRFKFDHHAPVGKSLDYNQFVCQVRKHLRLHGDELSHPNYEFTFVKVRGGAVEVKKEKKSKKRKH